MHDPQLPSRHNHYVPEWYQKGFSCNGSPNFLLDMAPPHRRPDGEDVPARRKSPKGCFWVPDLYVTGVGESINDEIETVLFKGIDDRGAKAIRAFIKGDERAIHEQYDAFLAYLGAQKLRTPKGLDWIRSRYPTLSQVELMVELQHLRQLYATLWAESVKEIVSAEDAAAKFLVTDHPVATFNAAWTINEVEADGSDAPVEFNGTQTIFALDANHCLILTHLPYARRTPGLSLTSRRIHARHMAPTLIKAGAMIRSRRLTTDEVGAINHVLKSGARRFIAAAERDWLYPERPAPPTTAYAAEVLLPPEMELSRFGGEIYVGYDDGHTDYRDEYGRTSKSHEWVSKQAPEAPPTAEEECPCGSGSAFGECCLRLPAWERPPWNELSLRERNLGFIRAIAGILGLGTDRSWDDVRRELSDEHVIRIHNVVRGLWPERADLAALLPRPDERLTRALYMGPSDPRTVAPSVVGLLPMFDQVLVMDPFLHPALLRPEFSPTESPGGHKQQVLKNLMFWLTLEPLISAGKVLIFPDPAQFNPEYHDQMRYIVEQRTSTWKFTRDHMKEWEGLCRDDFQRTLFHLSDEALRNLAEEAPLELADMDPEIFVAGMRAMQRKDPYALLQPVDLTKDQGQFITTKSVNLELALFVAQLTGAAIVTDMTALWEHLHLHTTAAGGEDGVACSPLAYRAYAHPVDALAATQTEEERTVRSAFLELMRSISLGGAEQTMQVLLEDLRVRLIGLPLLETAEAAHAIDFLSLEISAPKSGFESATAQRLIVTFGRESIPAPVRIAFFRKPVQSDT